MIALTRGPQSLYPCPRDLTPHNELRINGEEYERRNAMKTREIIDEAMVWYNAARSKMRAEELLKQYSLRAVKVN